MWDWVGGRTSELGPVGLLPAALQGIDVRALLAGAKAMDAVSRLRPLEKNPAALMALSWYFLTDGKGAKDMVILPYKDRLLLLSRYLQQLVMESLGKRVRLDGSPVAADTVPVWWGGAGTDVQHSFFQALHQGTGIVPADFIGTVHNDDPYAVNHDALLSNLLAQTEALANGQSNDDPHRAYAGGRPSTLLLLDALTPETLGMLVAMYEHSVYLQAVSWGINAFDQFGVELGKQVANRLLPALRGEAEADDAVTRAFLEEISRRR